MFEQLTDVFAGAAFKYLSQVDASPTSSNQHEIGGLPKAGIGGLLPMPNDGTQVKLPATLVYLDDNLDESITVDDMVTWYDSRYSNPNRSPEWRLYYKSNDVSNYFKPTDFFVIAVTKEQTLLMVFCPQGSDYEQQLRTLFSIGDTKAKERGLTKIQMDQRVAVPVRLMFARYGIEIGSDGANYLNQILDKFGNRFPKTREFSDFARTLSSETCPEEDPDLTLIEWMETEESAFRQLEKHIVQEKLKQGFGENGDDVDDFISFSLSVQNRRKSRSGHAFENHIEVILKSNKLKFERGAKTEGKRKPDFLFPSSVCYADMAYPEDRLMLLGAKTTCKDRWRQVLAEADRIPRKHLLTMEPAISSAQTDEMISQKLQLVVPKPVHSTYSKEQTDWLMSFKSFIKMAKLTQA